MQHFSKFAGASLVAFVILSVAWGSAVCHMSNCAKYMHHCSVHEGVVVCSPNSGS